MLIHPSHIVRGPLPKTQNMLVPPPPSPPAPYCYFIITYSLHISGPFLEALFHSRHVQEISFHFILVMCEKFCSNPWTRGGVGTKVYVTHTYGKLKFIFLFWLKSIWLGHPFFFFSRSLVFNMFDLIFPNNNYRHIVHLLFAGSIILMNLNFFFIWSHPTFLGFRVCSWGVCLLLLFF